MVSFKKNGAGPKNLSSTDGLSGHKACLILALLLAGCQTASPKQQVQGESREEVQEALTAVAGALSGKQLSQEELSDLEHQIRTDAQAQSAIQAITDSVGGATPVVKFCPVTGRRYAAHLQRCPVHDVLLEVVSP